MTYSRDPMTFEAALDMIVDRIGQPAALKVARRARRTLADWSNPHCELTPPIKTALALDCAWRASGGTGAPMLDTYRRLFESSAPSAVAVDQGALPDLTVLCIKEGAEAKAALVVAMQPSATARQRREALQEVTQGIAAFESTLPHLMVLQPP
ncbi:hypothetical protein [Sphingomonas sp. 2378]|uniref:hypothetical protein n=1 Tax=Sphingomonas sp. 2378 TaxID=1219748 RepID=UPI00311B1F49